MKQNYIIILTMVFLVSQLNGQQEYLAPESGYKLYAIQQDYKDFSSLAVSGDTIFASDGDTIFIINKISGMVEPAFIKPANYSSYPGFLEIDKINKCLWTGFTSSGNADDRIYMIDQNSGSWELKAHLAGNTDLGFIEEHLLVSGLNSTDWTAPNAIFVLDTSGNEQHRKIIETGGSSTGFSINQSGAIFSGTNSFAESNAIFKWSEDTVKYILENTEALHLDKNAAEKLTDIPAGAYDCELDSEGNLIFTFNTFGGDKVIAYWNGQTGDGYNYDTIAYTSGDYDWLSYVETSGSITSNEAGNSIYTLSWGRPIAELHADYRPVVSNPLKDTTGEKSSKFGIDISSLFSDPDDDSTINLSIETNSEPTVVSASISNDSLFIELLEKGVSSLVIKGESNMLEAKDTMVISVLATGIDDSKLTGLVIYPNPSNGVFRIMTGSDFATRVHIFNAQGGKVYTTEEYEGQKEINISDQPAGVYIISIETRFGNHTSTIVLH